MAGGDRAGVRRGAHTRPAIGQQVLVNTQPRATGHSAISRWILIGHMLLSCWDLS